MYGSVCIYVHLRIDSAYSCNLITKILLKFTTPCTISLSSMMSSFELACFSSHKDVPSSEHLLGMSIQMFHKTNDTCMCQENCTAYKGL